MKLTYRVYEANNFGESTVYLVAMSSLREISLRKEISQGERLMKLGALVAETDDRNDARKMANCEV